MKQTLLILLLLSMGWTGQVWAGTPATPAPTPAPSPVIQGNYFGLGDPILDGRDVKEGGNKFEDLFTSWLNEHYGPVTEMHKIADTSADLNAQVESSLAGVTINLCLLEIGMRNLDVFGGPNVSWCGYCPLSAGLSSAFHFGNDLQHIFSVIRSHLAPGGIILMTNLYEADDYTYAKYSWKDYPGIVGEYNRIAAMAAAANGVKVIDLYTLMASNPAYRDPHDLYPNSAGQAAIAALLEKAVEEEAPFKPQGKATKKP